MNYYSYDIEFYLIVQALKHWRHYLIQQEFILNSNDETLCYLKFQRNFNRHHAKWSNFLQEYTFTLRYKFGVMNRDALSGRASLLITLEPAPVSFDSLKGMCTQETHIFAPFGSLANLWALTPQLHT